MKPNIASTRMEKAHTVFNQQTKILTLDHVRATLVNVPSQAART